MTAHTTFLSLNSIDELGISSSCLSCQFLLLTDTSSGEVILKHGEEEEGGWNLLSRGSSFCWVWFSSEEDYKALCDDEMLRTNLLD